MNQLYIVIEKSNDEKQLGKVVGIYEKPSDIPEKIHQEELEHIKFGTKSKHKIVCVTIEEVNTILNRMSIWYEERYGALTQEKELKKEWRK